MVFEMLRELLVDALGCDEDEVTVRTELRDDLNLSDAELQSVMDAMAGELGFRYDEDKLDSLKTVGQMVRYIASLV